MSRYHRENPDAPIIHDAFEGARYVGVDPGAGKDQTVFPVVLLANFLDTVPPLPAVIDEKLLTELDDIENKALEKYK